MTKGQQAMAVAMIAPEAKEGRPTKGKLALNASFGATYLSKARAVLAYSNEAIARERGLLDTKAE